MTSGKRFAHAAIVFRACCDSVSCSIAGPRFYVDPLVKYVAPLVNCVAPISQIC